LPLEGIKDEIVVKLERVTDGDDASLEENGIHSPVARSSQTLTSKQSLFCMDSLSSSATELKVESSDIYSSGSDSDGRCWDVDTLMCWWQCFAIVLMCKLMCKLMCWWLCWCHWHCLDVLMCYVLMCWCDVLVPLCWWLRWSVDNYADVLMCWCLMIVLMCWCVDAWCVDVVMCWRVDDIVDVDVKSD
jgi:hypothetical protein